MLMLPDDSGLFDPLLFHRLSFEMLLFIGALSKLSKPSDYQMPNLLLFGIAGDQEHVSGDSFGQHFVTCNAIVAERQEDPGNVGLDGDVHRIFLVVSSKAVEEVEYPFLNQDIDRFLAQRKMNQSQRAILPDFKLLVLISAEIHDQVDYPFVYDLVE